MITKNDIFSCLNCGLLQPQNAFCYQCVKKGFVYDVEKHQSGLCQFCPKCEVHYSDNRFCFICKEQTKVDTANHASDHVHRTYKKFSPRVCNACEKLVWNGESCCGKGTFIIRNMLCRVLWCDICKELYATDKNHSKNCIDGRLALRFFDSFFISQGSSYLDKIAKRKSFPANNMEESNFFQKKISSSDELDQKILELHERNERLEEEIRLLCARLSNIENMISNCY